MKKNIYNFLLATFFCFTVYQTKAQAPNWGWTLPLTVSQSGNNLNLSVFDPIQNQTKTAQINCNGTYINNEGLVAGIYNNSIQVAVYDLNLHQFKTDSWSASSNTFSNFTNINGIIAWSNSSRAYVAVYDPSLQTWRSDSYSTSSSTFDDFVNMHGVVAWSNSSRAYVAVYDPSLQTWKSDSYSASSSTFDDFVNMHGVVAWSNSSRAYVAIYDPSLQTWKSDSYSASSNIFSNFTNTNGVVAWSNSSRAYVAVYDPALQTWKSDSYSASSSNFTSFSNTDGTITYNNSSSNYKYGYNKNSNTWQSNYNTDLYCKFFVTNVSSGNNFIFYLWCLTYGSGSNSYNCGDGHTITRRWAWKQYANPGNYVPTLNIFNSNTNSSCSENITIASVKNNFLEDNSVSIYPNPSSSEIKIKAESEISSIKITDVMGNLKKQSSIGQLKEIQIDLSDLAKGIYFIELEQQQKISTRKLVVQ